MWRFTFLAALLCLLISGTTTAQVVDSVNMQIFTYKYGYFDFPYHNCGAGIYATWPDVGKKGAPNGYSAYSLVAEGKPEDGFYIPSIGQTGTRANVNIFVPDGHYGLWSMGTGGQGSESGYETCADWGALYESIAAGARLPGPFQISKWYAVWTVPNGKPVADFDWVHTEGLSVEFDGSFDKSFEAEDGKKIPVASYSWDMGDNTMRAGPAFTHSYSEPGTYSVTLTVTDNDGETEDITKQVEVSGLVLQYEEEIVQRSVVVGETFTVIGKVKNIGLINAAEVRVRPLFGFLPEFVESDELMSTDATRSSPAQSTTEQIFSNLGPGQQVTFTQIYTVVTGATRDCDILTEDCEDDDIPVTVQWEATAAFVSGVDDDGNRAKVRDKCTESVECPLNKMLVTPAPLNASLNLTTDTGSSSSIPSGIERRRTTVGNNLLAQHIDPLTSKCHSGCVEVEVIVTDPQSDPVEGAVVELSAADFGDPIVPQGSGMFCSEDATPSCGSALTLDPTGPDGKRTARFWFPGVTEQSEGTIKVTARATGFAATESVQQITVKPTNLGLLPNGLAMGLTTTTPRQNEMEAWRLVASINNGSRVSLVDPLCGAMNVLRKKRASRSIGDFVSDAFDTAMNDVCGRQLTIYEGLVENNELFAPDVVSLLEGVDALADIASLDWFLKEYRHSLVGAADDVSLQPAVPFLNRNSDFADRITAAVKALGEQYKSTGIVPGTALNIYEVSYRSAVSDFTSALLMKYSTTGGGAIDLTSYIDDGYDASKWLTFDSQNSAITNAVATKSDVELSITLGTSSMAKAFGTENIATGQILVVDFGTEAEEVVQVSSISDSVLALTTPLQFDHPIGTSVARIDSLAVGPPLAPVATGNASGLPGKSLTPTLSWYTRSPASTYEVEVSTDAEFANIVQAHGSLEDAEVTLDPLGDRVKYYWRARATNNIATGPWSEVFSFATGSPAGDNLNEALTLSLDLPSSYVSWNIGTAMESGELQSSCGLGDNSIWFALSPTSTGSIGIESFESDFNTVLSVWSGSSHPLQEITCNDDWQDSRGDITTRSYVDFDAVAGTTYYVRVAGVDNEEGLAVVRTRMPTTVDVETEVPAFTERLALSVYPNPVSTTGTMEIQQSESGRATIEMFDTLGRRISKLSHIDMTSGTHSIAFNADHLPSGVYLLRVTTESESITRPFTVAR